MTKDKILPISRFKEIKVPDEAQIMASWESGTREPVISVLCNTYNHASYIEDALKGFLIQSTTFPFEVIIHDDASTDGTSDIIKTYAQKYPGIIKPVLQYENQYSKGRKPTPIALKHARGKFIALCEGDDFWVSSEKLEAQYRVLSDKDSIDICFSNAYTLAAKGEIDLFLRRRHQDIIVRASDIARGGGQSMPTASVLLRASILHNLPEWFSDAPVGDYFIQVLASIRGGAYFIHAPLCCYRVASVGSWSASRATKSIADLSQYVESQTICVTHLKRANPSLVKDFDCYLAKEYFYLSMSCLLRKEDECFKNGISASWKLKPFLSIRQLVLFWLKNMPVFVRLLLRVKNLI